MANWFGPCGDCGCNGQAGVCPECNGFPGKYLARQTVDITGVPNNIKAYNGSVFPQVEYDLSGFSVCNDSYEVVRNANCTWPTVEVEIDLTGTVTTYTTPFPTIDLGPFKAKVQCNDQFWRCVLLRPYPTEDWLEFNTGGFSINFYSLWFAFCDVGAFWAVNWDYRNSGAYPAGSTFTLRADFNPVLADA